MTELSRRTRLLAYATGAFGLAANAIIQFLVPLRADELGIGIGAIGILLGVKALTEALVSIPVGGLMDRIGARRAFMLGTGLSAIIGFGFIGARGFLSLFALQVVLGVTRPLGWVGGQSYVAGLRTGTDRAYDTGRFSFAANLAQIVAPLAVGFTSQVVGIRVSFGVFGIYAAVFVLLGLLLPDVVQERSGSKQNSFGSAVTLLRLRGIQVAMLLTFSRLFVPAAWTSFFPLFLVQSGVPLSAAGSVISAMALTATFMNLLSGRLSRLGSAEVVTAVGLGVSALGLAVSPFLASVPWMYAGAVLVGVGQGISLPLLITIVSNAAPESQRGLALGLRSSVNQTAAAIAPVAVAPIIGAAGMVVGLPVAGAVVATTLIAAVVLHRRPTPS